LARGFAKACFRFALAALFCFQATLSGAQATAPPASHPAEEQATIAAALEQTKQNQNAKALALLEQVLSADPNNESVNLLAAGAAIGAFQPDVALKYAQKAHELDPADWKVHLTLLAADAGTGRLRERDAERELVRQFHNDGKHSDAAQSNGFMIEYFPVKNYRVRAIEYFAPVGKTHFVYRFAVFDQDQKPIWAVALESDDLDQASWAAAHKEQAAAGEREYSLDGYGKDAHTTYRNYSGKPTYDEVKAEVVKVLGEMTPPAGKQAP
jgi:tetratricopeptide (TPR) repeat protein